jgi:hypothetical protein
MESYNITYKDLKNAINKTGYENHNDIWYLFDIIISQRGYSLDYIKEQLLSAGIRDKKKFIILLGIKLKQIMDDFLTLHGLTRYIGDWHVNESIKGNLRDPDVMRKIKLYNNILTTLKKDKEEEKKMLMEFTDFYDEL